MAQRDSWVGGLASTADKLGQLLGGFVVHDADGQKAGLDLPASVQHDIDVARGESYDILDADLELGEALFEHDQGGYFVPIIVRVHDHRPF